jgi:hypothetical protein
MSRLGSSLAASLATALENDHGISDADLSTFDGIGPKASPVHQSPEHAMASEFLQVCAGMALPRTNADSGPDSKLTTDQAAEIDPRRYEIPPELSRINGRPEISLRFDQILPRYEGELAPASGLARPVTGAGAVTISLYSLTLDYHNAGSGDHGRSRRGS